jgi:YidC/Oxa1 family membrane protein insertase
MRRITSMIILAALVLVAGQLFAAQPSSQQGLPPELTISAKPSYQQQLQTLQALRTFTAQNKPSGGGGGILSGLKSLLGGGGGAAQGIPVAPAALALSGDQLRGKLVKVIGIYQKTSPDGGVIPFEGGTIAVSMPAGITIEGFNVSGPSGLPVTVEGVVEAAGGAGVQVRATSVRPDGPLVGLRIARIQELLNQPEAAMETYNKVFGQLQASKSPFAAYATTAAARVAYDLRDVKASRKHYAMAWNPFTGRDKQGRPLHYTWVPNQENTGWEKLGIAQAIKGPLDTLNKKDIWYRFMDFFVLLAGGQRWLGIIFLAVISRVVIWPLTKKQLSSAESMKRLQPQIKALQDKHVDDKQKFQEEFWKLCQANGVNPLGGCLPMIAQMPVLIVLWNGIRNYIAQFDGHGFLWVKNLAAPDMGLLVLYTISMIFFQKMTQKLQPAPTMNPQQAQQQQMMTYMMPLMFFFFFQSFPAAFLLYWLATNMVYFVQQYTYTKGVERQARLHGVESLVPAAGKPAGFAGAMAKMMSLKSEQQADKGQEEAGSETKPPADTKSFHEKQAESKGKKIEKGTEPESKKRRR